MVEEHALVSRTVTIDQAKLNTNEIIHVRQYLDDETKHLRGSATTIFWLNHLAGALYGIAFSILGWLISLPSWVDHTTALVTLLTLFLIGLLLTRFNFVNREKREKAALYAPADAAYRLAVLAEECERLEAECNSREEEVEALMHRLENSDHPLTTWSALQTNLHESVLAYARRVNAQLVKRTIPDDDEFLRMVDDEFRSILQDLVGKMFEYREVLFEHSADINFCDVFELENDNLCHLVARKKSDHAQEHLRTWTVNKGHIGNAIYVEQALLENVAPADRVPSQEAQFCETDPSYFPSRITAPIPAVGRKPYNYYGVIVVTSSMLGGLKRRHLAFVNSLAHSLTSLFFTRERAHSKVEKRKFYH
jgi:hypothetical protein